MYGVLDVTYTVYGTHLVMYTGVLPIESSYRALPQLVFASDTSKIYLYHSRVTEAADCPL